MSAADVIDLTEEGDAPASVADDFPDFDAAQATARRLRRSFPFLPDAALHHLNTLPPAFLGLLFAGAVELRDLLASAGEPASSPWLAALAQHAQRSASRAAAEAEADSDSCSDEGEDADDDDVDASLALAWKLQAEYDSSAAWMDAALACGGDDDAGEPAAGGATAAPGLQGPGFVGWRWQEGAPRAARRPPPAPPPPLRADDAEVIRTVRTPFSGGRHVTWTWDGTGSVWRPDSAPLSGKPYLQVCFLSDTHGAQALLDSYMALDAVRECDAVIHTGDAVEYESGLSVLELEGYSRDFAAWFASLPHQYKLLTAGNHDVFSVAGELDELRGAAAPAAGARPRAYIRARGEFALYLQNEGCVIPMPGGGEVSIHARTFHTGIGGCFQYDTDPISGFLIPNPGSPASTYAAAYPALFPAATMDEVLLKCMLGAWPGRGDDATILLSHAPPYGILDSVESGKGRPSGLSCSNAALLARCRANAHAVVAFGHVHAMQGAAYLAWKHTDAAKAWRAAQRKAWAQPGANSSGRDNVSGGFLPPPPGAPRPRRVVASCDLSDVGAATAFEPAPPAPPRTVGDKTPKAPKTPIFSVGELASLQRDLSKTLFVNAACLDAVIPEAQHGWARLKGADGQRGPIQLIAPAQPGQRPRVAPLRPPIVVRVWPDRRWEVVPLGVTRFPEGALPPRAQP